MIPRSCPCPWHGDSHAGGDGAASAARPISAGSVLTRSATARRKPPRTGRCVYRAMIVRVPSGRYRDQAGSDHDGPGTEQQQVPHSTWLVPQNVGEEESGGPNRPTLSATGNCSQSCARRVCCRRRVRTSLCLTPMSSYARAGTWSRRRIHVAGWDGWQHCSDSGCDWDVLGQLKGGFRAIDAPPPPPKVLGVVRSVDGERVEARCRDGRRDALAGLVDGPSVTDIAS